MDPLSLSRISSYLSEEEMLRSLMEIDTVKQGSVIEDVSTFSRADTVEKLDAPTLNRTLTFDDLPPELVRLILYDAVADSSAVQRLLLAVCYRWRVILVNTPSLWTWLHIGVAQRPNTADNATLFQRLLCRLDLQLQRCGSHMLDVYWANNLSCDQNTELFTLLRKRAPFSRWRKLVIGYTRVYGPLEDEILSGMDDFRNLTSLIIASHISDQLLRRINDSVTSKLAHVAFDTHQLSLSLSQFNTGMSSILRCHSSIRLPHFEDDSTVILPANIKEVKTWSLPHCASPHVTSLTVTDWTNNRQYDNQYFPNLEYLSTPFAKQIGITTTLTVLTTLIVTGNEFRPLATMKLPSLRVLRIGTADQYIYTDRYTYAREIESLRAAITMKEMSLNPTDTLQINLPLPADCSRGSSIEWATRCTSWGFGYEARTRGGRS